MKKFSLCLVLALIFIATSCSEPFYQVYNVDSENGKLISDGISFEDDNCVVYYNLWADAGNFSYIFKNKLDKDITIDLTHSFCIKNGVAFDYYQEQTVTKNSSVSWTSTSGLTATYNKLLYNYPTWTPNLIQSQTQLGTIGAVGTSVSTKTQSTIVIPAKSAKVIPGFSISNYVYNECGNSNFNTPKQQSKEIVYTKETTPLTFSNRIAYFIDNAKELTYMQNDFWVSSLTNYSGKYIIEKTQIEECVGGNILMKKMVNINTKQSPNRFYNTYKKTMNSSISNF